MTLYFGYAHACEPLTKQFSYIAPVNMYFLKSTLHPCIWSVGHPNESSGNNNFIQ